MKAFTLAAVTAVLLIGWPAVGCSAEDPMTSESMRALIEKELAIGARSSEIESFFKRHDLPFTYDRFAKRYQSIVRDVSSDPKIDQAIVIHVYVDEEKRFKKHEVRDSFTAP